MSRLEYEIERMKRLVTGIEKYQNSLSDILKMLKEEIQQKKVTEGFHILNDISNNSFDFGIKALLNLQTQLEDDFYNRFRDLLTQKLVDGETMAIYVKIKDKISSACDEIIDEHGEYLNKEREELTEDIKTLIRNLEKYCQVKLESMDNEFFIRDDDDIDHPDELSSLITELQDAVKDAYIKYTVGEILSSF